MKKRINLKEKYREFKAWQMQPCQMAPLSAEEHDCKACGTHYMGNYCPRCGQAARVGRYSIKVAMQNFADVWGLGNRGMFRTIRDLILRPGYMIRDYLKGMQMAYFPPFKMFFLLTALSLLVTHGFNVKGVNHAHDVDTESAIQNMKEGMAAKEGDATVEINDSSVDVEKEEFVDRFSSIVAVVIDKLAQFARRFPSIFMMLALMIFSGYFYLYFKRCPNIPDLRSSEFFVALIYITNMYTIYSIVFDFFCLDELSTLSILLTLIPLKQLCGFSWWRTILKSSVAYISAFVLLIAFFVLAMFCIGLFVQLFG